LKIEVQFYAQLQDLAGISHLHVKVFPGASVADLLESIYELKPALRAHDKSVLVGSGVEFVSRSHSLREGEEIAIMPPVQGG